MKEQIVSTKAPAAIGPYSQAIKYGNLVFASGQLALDSETGLVEGDIKEQTTRALNYLKNVLEEGGSGLDKVLKVTVFLADITDFAVMNDIYSQFFTVIPPARSAFQVAALPKNARVEIEAIAYCD